MSAFTHEYTLKVQTFALVAGNILIMCVNAYYYE